MRHVGDKYKVVRQRSQKSVPSKGTSISKGLEVRSSVTFSNNVNGIQKAEI